MARGDFKCSQNGSEVSFYIRQGEKEFAMNDLPWEAAQMIGRALLEKGLLAEQHAKANEIIQDQAIMFRSGAPFALSDDPKILEEAKKEAVWNRDLRRSNLRLADAGIPSSEQVGVPTVTQGPAIVHPKIIPAK
jgi:hypothetical protein